MSVTRKVREDGTLRFVIKAQDEGLGTIVWVQIYWGGRVAWMDCVLLPEAGPVVEKALAECVLAVWPELPPIPATLFALNARWSRSL